MNGPEDFCYVVERFYALGSRSKRRFCRAWLSYVNDQTIRTGRVLDGTWMSDEEYDERLRVAARAAERSTVLSAAWTSCSEPLRMFRVFPALQT